jgi:hypothetical protein
MNNPLDRLVPSQAFSQIRAEGFERVKPDKNATPPIRNRIIQNELG